jgi:transcriptional regulator with XRE-family HTH domain|uniref:helix-turn-helix domain-containing protein n=1 Tax=Candidatus Stercorousia sp. TaxID=3048886 RepID=UPI0040266871
MQYKSEKTLHLINQLGKIIKSNRLKKENISLNTFAYEYDLNPGNLSRVENGQIEPKITMLWRIAEALEIPLSEIIKQLENDLGKDFFITDK